MLIVSPERDVDIVQVPPMERIYRYFWRQKGDVYALLWDMQR